MASSLNDVPEEIFDHRNIVVDDLKDGKNESSEIIEKQELHEAKLTAMSKFKIDDQTNTFGMVRAFHYTVTP